MFVMRVVSMGDIQKPVMMRDTRYDTKRECLRGVSMLGELSAISKVRDRGDTLYIVTPKPKK